MQIPQRSASPSEEEFFNRSNIPGYAAEDDSVVMNPAELPGVNKEAVKENEGMRVYLRKTQPKDMPKLTAEQEKIMDSLPHYNNADDYTRRSTVMARILSGDPTAGQPTQEQLEFVKKHRQRYQIKEITK